MQEQSTENGVHRMFQQPVFIGKKPLTAADAESNKTYAVWTGEFSDRGKMVYVSADFLCQGRGMFRGYTFFRKSPRIYGVKDYTVIKEVDKKIQDAIYG